MCSCKPSSLLGLGDSDACQNLRTTGIVDAVDQHFKMKFHWNTHRLQSCITNRPVTSEAEHITQTCALQKNFLQKRIFLQKKKNQKKKKVSDAACPTPCFTGQEDASANASGGGDCLL